jgi:16S rRNA (guanine527-N7)-methyltransferase
MPVLVELCLPFVRPGGRLLAMKTAAETEVAAATAAIEILGGRLEAIQPAPSRARLSGEIVVVRKVAATPERFPRRPGIPARRPLGRTQPPA